MNIEERKEMNVYAKIQRARKLLVEGGLKKGKVNNFSKFSYFELGDFIPQINVIFDELGLFSKVTVNDQNGSLLIINTDKPNDYALFTCQSAPLELKGAVPLQSIGGQMTYIRKYLYMLALEISEVDILDSSDNGDVTNVKPQNVEEPKKSSLKSEVTALCKEKSKENRAAVSDIIKKYNNGSMAVSKIDDEEILKQIKEEVEKL